MIYMILLLIQDYQSIVGTFSKLLLEKTNTQKGNADERLSGDELNIGVSAVDGSNNGEIIITIGTGAIADIYGNIKV